MLNIQYSIAQVQKELWVPLKELIVYICFKEPTVAFKKDGVSVWKGDLKVAKIINCKVPIKEPLSLY